MKHHKSLFRRKGTHKKIMGFALPQGQWRSLTVMGFVFLITTIIAIRLYSLQVVAHHDYRAVADNQHQVIQQLSPKRGDVYLKNGDDLYPLAINREYKMAYAVPHDIKNIEHATRALSQILALESDDVRSKLSKSEDPFEILKHRLSDDELRALEEQDFSGIHTLPEYFRFYPGGQLASHSVGFVGSDGDRYVGLYGIESRYEQELRGVAGSLQQERSAGGGWISVSDRLIAPAQDGVDLVLTIDYTAQFEVERILKETIEKHDADSGSIVVLDPRTGKIIALANEPSFDPNKYGAVEDISAFLNTAISQPYESGSVFKPITMAIGIDHGKIEPDSTFVDPGVVHAGGYPIRNSEEKTYGLQTMTQVLEESINTGVIHVQRLVGNKGFLDYVERFGFGSQTNISLPLDVGGNITNIQNLRRSVEFYTASFGQGITMTPLQLALAYGALANGGILMEPRIVEKKIFSDGREEVIVPQEVRRVTSEETSEKVSRMLRSVVVNGHGKRADVAGYSVGGKTGTAQVARIGERGYDDATTIGTFAGYAPTHDPRFVIVVKIENPKNVIWAEASAAPAFGKVMKYLLESYGIEPTEKTEVVSSK